MKKARDGEVQIPVNEEFLNTERAALKKFNALLRKTQVEEPRLEDVRALRKMLKDTSGLWRALGDLAYLSMQMVVQSDCFHPGMRVAIEAGIADIKKDYGYEDSPGPEKMLIDQVIVNWLQLQKTQIDYERVQRDATSIPTLDYWERRLTASNGRYLRACETLARVRKLSRPGAVQVNIGKQQVNVAQTARTADGDPAEQMKSIDVGRPALPGKL